MAGARGPATHAEPPGEAKGAVRQFWDRAACGEVYLEGESYAEQLREQARTRYALEPYIHDFARFADGAGKDVLEIGVGMGADHLEWALAGPRSLTGVDLTARAVDHTRARLALHGLRSTVRTGDAENLPFPDASFDLVYSWGVLHHTPDTPRAIREVWRVLRPGGVARIMIYHRHSLVGWMLWARYALLAGRPTLGLDAIYDRYLESPGTKAYSIAEARHLFAVFSAARVSTRLSFGDLLQGAVGQRHDGIALRLARALWPRWLIRRAFRRNGLYLLVEARK